MASKNISFIIVEEGGVGQYLTAHLSASATIGKMNQEEKVFNR